eukprot:7277723-Lingulodinium_polyedra.AAC.1
MAVYFSRTSSVAKAGCHLRPINVGRISGERRLLDYNGSRRSLTTLRVRFYSFVEQFYKDRKSRVRDSGA